MQIAFLCTLNGAGIFFFFFCYSTSGPKYLKNSQVNSCSPQNKANDYFHYVNMRLICYVLVICLNSCLTDCLKVVF